VAFDLSLDISPEFGPEDKLLVQFQGMLAEEEISGY
jgi:hypothetical protein